MAFINADRVKETTSTVGTGAYALDGAATGFRSFVAGIGTSNQCHYVAEDGQSFEVGVGTVTGGAPDTLSRDRIIASSNAGAAVSWSAGVKSIFCAPVAEGSPETQVDSSVVAPATVEAGSVSVSTAGKTHRFVNGRRVLRRTIRGYLPAKGRIATKVNGGSTPVLFSAARGGEVVEWGGRFDPKAAPAIEVQRLLRMFTREGGMALIYPVDAGSRTYYLLYNPLSAVPATHADRLFTAWVEYTDPEAAT